MVVLARPSHPADCFREASFETGAGSSAESRRFPQRALVLEEFTAAFERGEAPRAEAYLERLAADDSDGAVELIYREFCLVERGGMGPARAAYLARFPRHSEALERLFRLHDEFSASLLGRLIETTPGQPELPGEGDSIGPFVLRRELGRGSFARVFVAEQTNLENRLVVVKVTTRPTREPWLLARVRHAHIVEIMSHASVDDGAFQLICMPFWGGATLESVLAAARRRNKRPVSGRDLLADLDGVAAPEYPGAHPARPAREVLAGLSYDQALAWVVARLADALDHAYDRGVAHGDIKPSNILLSADGNPMLLDFNLARDWSPARPEEKVADRGGTLAYMAPERLKAVAEAGLSANGPRASRSHLRPTSEMGPAQGPIGEENPHLTSQGPHRADIYALGMVLLEALTGRPPKRVAGSEDQSANGRFCAFENPARTYARVRSGSARSLIREAEAAGYRMAPGLRVILARCLDPDPAARYGRSKELAEDLDRWRSNRALAFATEPLFSQSVPRWLRRQRRMLVALALSLVAGSVTLFLASVNARSTLQLMSLEKVAHYFDDPAGGAYRFQHLRPTSRAGQRSKPVVGHASQSADLMVLETAGRALRAYDVLGPGDWRLRDDVRFLPAEEREDLELWLMEQAYRYARVLDDRRDRADWRRARTILERIIASCPSRAFLALRDRLIAKPGRDGSPREALWTGSSAHGSPGEPASHIVVPEWLEEYLLGVAAEHDADLVARDGLPVQENLARNDQRNQAERDDEIILARQTACRRALAHYQNVLALRPVSYWGHYRAASAFCTLGEYENTARHIAYCVKRRSGNSLLRAEYSGCLWDLKQYPEALQECDKSLQGVPDVAEFFRTRAFIRASSGQTAGIVADLHRFELLSQRVPQSFWGDEPVDLGPSLEPSTSRVSGFPAPLDLVSLPADLAFAVGGERYRGEADPEDLDARLALARTIYEAGEPELASHEYTKILFLDPDHIGARVWRAILAQTTRRFDDARRDFDAVLGSPELPSFFREDPTSSSYLFRFAAGKYLESGRPEEAHVLARRALDYAIKFNQARGATHYILAQACAVTGRTHARYIEDAADQLDLAFQANPASYKSRYKDDRIFDPVRASVDELLRRKPDVSTRYER